MYLKDLFIPLLKSSESLLPLAPLYFCLLFTLITAVLLRNGLRMILQAEAREMCLRVPVHYCG